MPRISAIALFAIPEQTTLYVSRYCKSPEQFPAFIGESFGQLGKYLSELDELMTDFPYVAFDREPDGGFTVEAGFTVPRLLPGKDAIKSGAITGGKAVMCMYQGSYEDMEPFYKELQAWCDARGLRQKSRMYEFYYNGPDEVQPEQFLTRVLVPVE